MLAVTAALSGMVASSGSLWLTVSVAVVVSIVATGSRIIADRCCGEAVSRIMLIPFVNALVLLAIAHVAG